MKATPGACMHPLVLSFLSSVLPEPLGGTFPVQIRPLHLTHFLSPGTTAGCESFPLRYSTLHRGSQQLFRPCTALWLRRFDYYSGVTPVHSALSLHLTQPGRNSSAAVLESAPRQSPQAPIARGGSDVFPAAAISCVSTADRRECLIPADTFSNWRLRHSPRPAESDGSGSPRCSWSGFPSHSALSKGCAKTDFFRIASLHKAIGRKETRARPASWTPRARTGSTAGRQLAMKSAGSRCRQAGPSPSFSQGLRRIQRDYWPRYGAWPAAGHVCAGRIPTNQWKPARTC